MLVHAFCSLCLFLSSSLCCLSAFTQSGPVLYYKVYFWDNRHEMIWNDLCPLSDSKIAQVIGFVFNGLSPYFIFMYYLQLAADASCHSTVFSGELLNLVYMSHLHPDRVGF